MTNFCYNGFTGLDISPSGQIRPCCKFIDDNIPNFNIKDGIKAYRESEFLKNLQTQFLNDERPTECSRCWNEEDIGIKSKRQLDYERHKEYFDKIDLQSKNFKNISLAFGNLCNFACRICSPAGSSRWAIELSKTSNKQYPIYKWHQNPEVMQDIFDYTKDAIHFDIPGGEPFLTEIPEQFEFLQKFSNAQAKHISIHYTTNGSNFPQEKFLKTWDRFKEIDIQISIDDIEQRFEYNRWPGKWNKVYDNLQKFKLLQKNKTNIRLSISFTVSAFTILYADKFYNWCIEEELPTPWLGLLSKPYYYRPSVFNKEVRNSIKQKLLLSKHEEIRNLSKCLDQDDSEHLEHFNKIVEQYDSKRKQNFEKTFPELQVLLNG